VVVIEYGTEPAEDGKSRISARVTGFVKLDNPLVDMASKLVRSAAEAKAEKEARALVKLFARTTHAIDNDPAGVHELLSQRPDVSRRDLEEFRQLLQLP
jgi:hypothetical protein